MASVRRRGGIKKRGADSWLISFFKHVDSQGKRIDFSETVRGSKKEAEQFLQRKLYEYDQGVLTDNPRITLNEFFDQWLETHSRVRNSERTSYGDEAIYRRYFRETIGHKRLDAIRPFDIQRVYSDLLTKRHLAPQTIKHGHAVLRKALNQAVKCFGEKLSLAVRLISPNLYSYLTNRSSASTLQQLTGPSLLGSPILARRKLLRRRA